ncbi:MAG: phosphate ABC transporter substrate-binding protein PstS, partial [Acidobacteria bacterium]|nr:phosphate ABC transporter substrate-binding protein PstS [Acidobacteriota bacterium]
IALIATLILAGTLSAAGLSINGAGATFPYPVYAKWANAYAKETGVRLNYQSIGSGGGIAQIKASTVDFGASDAPLTKEKLDEFGLVQWPQIMGGVVPVVNLPGIAANELRLTPALLADIFLGRITRWNDPAIVTANPGVELPKTRITVVHRADGSGTTWIFTNYLDKVSPQWHTKVGTAKAVAWPAGVGGKGNEGVSAYVQRIRGAIGYVEFAYALQNHMTAVKLRNRDGRFVDASITSFQAAAANADWAHAPGFYLVLTDQPGEASWPITGASFILVHRSQKNQKKARAVLEFFSWAFAKGDHMATALDYVPIPDTVVSMVKAEWASKIEAGGQKVWTGK